LIIVNLLDGSVRGTDQFADTNRRGEILLLVAKQVITQIFDSDWVTQFKDTVFCPVVTAGRKTTPPASSILASDCPFSVDIATGSIGVDSYRKRPAVGPPAPNLWIPVSRRSPGDGENWISSS
jgi:hypothetical protein